MASHFLGKGMTPKWAKWGEISVTRSASCTVGQIARWILPVFLGVHLSLVRSGPELFEQNILWPELRFLRDSAVVGIKNFPENSGNHQPTDFFGA